MLFYYVNETYIYISTQRGTRETYAALYYVGQAQDTKFSV